MNREITTEDELRWKVEDLTKELGEARAQRDAAEAAESSAWKECHEARAALVELCDLKRLKDRLPSVVEPANAMREYTYRKPLAWVEAFRIAYGPTAPSHAKEGGADG